METWFKTTRQFEQWRKGLGATSIIRLDARVERARREGHFGDQHGVRGRARDGGRISEMRLDFGPGYRLYYTVWKYKGMVTLLILGGDKSTQRRDIKRALALLPAAKADAEREIDEALKRREEEKRGK